MLEQQRHLDAAKAKAWLFVHLKPQLTFYPAVEQLDFQQLIDELYDYIVSNS